MADRLNRITMSNKSVITPALMGAIFEQPWNISGGHWRSIAASITSTQGIALSDFFTPRQGMSIDDRGIAHISIQGILGDHSPISQVFGDSDYNQIALEIEEADSTAAGAIFHHNSPGGQTTGNLEVAQMAAGMSIPTLSFCEGMMCSASYKIAAGTDKIISSPSAIVGSIGTIMPYYDTSQALEGAGVKADFITSGDLKGAGMAPSLTEAQRESLQELVDDLGQSFKNHVTTYRAVDEDTMRGQAFVAPRAKAKNLIDYTGTNKDAYRSMIEMIG